MEEVNFYLTPFPVAVGDTDADREVRKKPSFGGREGG
jgi:hypothetical protein